MKIAIVSTNDIDGGAARAAHGLYSNLAQLSNSVKYFVKNKYVVDDNVIQIRENLSIHDQNLKNLIKFELHKFNTKISNTLFDISYTNKNNFPFHLFKDIDIINLHWVTNFLSPEVIYKLSNQKHIIWTMHDQAALTGGCHYTASCEGFRQDCFDCKQVKFPSGRELQSLYFKEKLNFLSNIPITFVVASKWMESCIKQSRLFSKHRIEYIPYSIDASNTFFPIEKSKARKALGIPADKISILFGADNGNDKRKGFHLLLDAFRILKNNILFRNLIEKDRIQMVVLGKPNLEITEVGIPIVSFERINDDKKLNLFYNSGDFFVLPSIEDNLPLVMLESISTGTPIIAFDTGGMRDVIGENINGRLVALADVNGLADSILDFVELSYYRKLGDLSHKCREFALNNLSNPIESKKYMKLFEDIVSKKLSENQPSVRSNFGIYKSLFKYDSFVLYINLIFLKIFTGLYHSIFSEHNKDKLRKTKIFRFIVNLFPFTKL